MCNKLRHWKLKGVQIHQTSEDTHYSKIRSTVSVHSPQQLQRHLQQHQACRASTLTLAHSKRYSIPQRQCNQPSMDVFKEIATGLLGTQRGTKVADANVYVRSLNKLNPSIAVDIDCCAAASIRACTMSVDTTTSECSSQAARRDEEISRFFHSFPSQPSYSSPFLDNFSPILLPLSFHPFLSLSCRAACLASCC